VLKVSIFLLDVGDRSPIDPVRQERFGGARPASTLVEVSGLAVFGAKIEVDAIAAVRT
jgi:2-iminobutanoate/2-iminopropanoate deaminase